LGNHFSCFFFTMITTIHSSSFTRVNLKSMLTNYQKQTTQQHPVLSCLADGDLHGGPTAMANVLVASLAECDGLDIEDLTGRYLEWWRSDGFDTGPVFNDVMALIDQGVSQGKAPRIVDKNHNGLTAGCNPAHRIAPLSLMSSTPIERLPDLAIQEARITHHHPLAGNVSAAVAVLIRALLDGMTYEKAKAFAAKGRFPETREALLYPDDCPLSTSGFSPEALRAAIHFIDQSSSASEAIKEASLFAGDGNYCPVLVGAISGARW
jgi:ADP-ribosyl-[dinitrogen reductase] hydrolase